MDFTPIVELFYFCCCIFIIIISLVLIIIWIFKKKKKGFLIIGLILFIISISIILSLFNIAWIKFKKDDLIGVYTIDTTLIDKNLMTNYKYQDCKIYLYNDNSFYISDCELLNDNCKTGIGYSGKGEWEIEDRNKLYLHFIGRWTSVELKKKRFKTCIIFYSHLDAGDAYEIIYTKID